MKPKHYILIGIFVIIILACLPKNTTTPRSANVPNTAGTGGENGNGGTGGNTPIITITGTPTAFSTTVGTVSATKNYSLTGAYLTANITLTAPNGFEISLNSNNGFGSTLSLSQTNGSVSATTIYVRLTGAAVGAVSGNISHSSTDAITQNLALSGVVNEVESNAPVEIFNYTGDNTGEDVDFSSHSIVSKPVSNVGVDLGVANSFCEYWVYDTNNVLKLYVKNTRSGLHPNYANSFNHNNHLPQFSKKLSAGAYRLVYRNISTDAGVRQRLTFGLIQNNGIDQINEDVMTGEEVERTINIYISESSHFKLNNNVNQ